MLLNAISYLCGNCLLLLCRTLPNATLVYSVALLIILLTSLCCIAASQIKISKVPITKLLRASIWVLKVASIAAMAFSWAVYQAQAHQANILPYALEKQPLTVIGYIDSFPQVKPGVPGVVAFKFVVQDSENLDTLNLGTIKLTWQTNLKLELGQRWQFIVRLKRPRGLANPGSFDVEKQSFQQRITAIGYVYSKHAADAQLIDDSSINVSSGKISHAIRKWLHAKIITALGEKEFVGTILALTLGMQQAISPQHWQVWQQTGVAHLLAISGLHIGFLAGLTYKITTWLWRRMPMAWLKLPVPQVGAIAALMAAYSYTFLAGFSVSAQRALVMVAVAMLAILYKRKITAVIGFAWALILVLVLDPLAVLSAAFWLSFVAVAILLYTFSGRKKLTGILQWLKPHLVLALGVLPLGINYFGNIVLIAPLANLILVPYVSFLVVPLALLGIVFTPLFTALAQQCWIMAEWLLAGIWPWLIKLQAVPAAKLSVSSPAYWQLVLASIGIAWLLAPHGFPGKIFGCYAILPLLIVNSSNAVDQDVIKITMLDVGQGLSIVLETKHHVLLYDTGPKFSGTANAGDRVIWPYLRSQGIYKIDKIIVSHADLDHAGGLISLMQHIMPPQILTPSPDALKIDPEIGVNIQACRAGQHWEWDGVKFEMLHPVSPLLKKRNDHSCVLRVSSKLHSILFTGDISGLAEQQLLANYAAKLPAEILMIPHHGSASSSADEFVAQVGPRYALVSVGYLNRYGHPKPQVVEKYAAHGSVVLDTASLGAISLKLNDKNKNIKANCYRIEQHKFWHEP